MNAIVVSRDLPFAEAVNRAVDASGLRGGLSFDYLALVGETSWGDLPDGVLLGQLVDADREIGRPLADLYLGTAPLGSTPGRSFGKACHYCGVEGTYAAPLTRDHVVPDSLVRRELVDFEKGGFTKRNLVPACRACNGRKGDRHLRDHCGICYGIWDLFDGLRERKAREASA